MSQEMPIGSGSPSGKSASDAREPGGAALEVLAVEARRRDHGIAERVVGVVARIPAEHDPARADLVDDRPADLLALAAPALARPVLEPAVALALLARVLAAQLRLHQERADVVAAVLPSLVTQFGRHERVRAPPRSRTAWRPRRRRARTRGWSRSCRWSVSQMQWAAVHTVLLVRRVDDRARADEVAEPDVGAEDLAVRRVPGAVVSFERDRGALRGAARGLNDLASPAAAAARRSSDSERSSTGAGEVERLRRRHPLLASSTRAPRRALSPPPACGDRAGGCVAPRRRAATPPRRSPPPRTRPRIGDQRRRRRRWLR